MAETWNWPPVRSLCLGLVGAAIPWAIAATLSDHQALEFWAVPLAVAAAIYVGSALANGHMRVLLMETGIALGFIVLALAGLWWSPWFLVFGWAAHGLWDLTHHGDGRAMWSAPVAVGFYPLACLSFDLVVAVGIVLRFP